MKKEKLVLDLDSQMLSSYAKCPESFNFNYIQQLTSTKEKTAFDKGSLVHLMLALFYKLQRRGFSAEKAGMLVVKRFIRFKQKFNLDEQTEKFILQRFFEYFNLYLKEQIQPIGIEVGFSEKLFEDKNFIFIYSGRIDMIAFEEIEVNGKNKEKRLHFTDHKTRAQSYDLDCYVNQFFGYAWAMKQVYGPDYNYWGKINYFGLQEDKNNYLAKKGKLFEKVWFQFSEAQINQWKNDTIFWFHRIAQSKLFNIFPRTWNCSNNFGVCDYKRICQKASPWEKKLVSGIPYFEKKEKAWRSWS